MAPMVKKSARWWAVSEDAEAVRWRETCTGGAYLRMVNAAVEEETRGTFDIPRTIIEDPPQTPGTYFTLPGSASPAKAGTHFTIPEESE